MCSDSSVSTGRQDQAAHLPGGPRPGRVANRLIQEGATLGAFDDRFTLRGIKVVFDGALGSKGAALLEPYSDYDTAGFLTAKEEDVLPMLDRGARGGHPGRDARDRRPRQPRDSRSVREGLQRGAGRSSARCASRAGESSTRRSSTRRYSALRQARRDSFDAAFARDRRSAFRAEPTGHETARGRVLPGRVLSSRGRSSPADRMRRSSAASR